MIYTYHNKHSCVSSFCAITSSSFIFHFLLAMWVLAHYNTIITIPYNTRPYNNRPLWKLSLRRESVGDCVGLEPINHLGVCVCVCVCVCVPWHKNMHTVPRTLIPMHTHMHVLHTLPYDTSLLTHPLARRHKPPTEGKSRLKRRSSFGGFVDFLRYIALLSFNYYEWYAKIWRKAS